MENASFRAAVGAFIVNEEGRLLVILKHNYVERWDIPKGGINRGESDLEALNRELKEELGDIRYDVLEKSKLSLVKIKYKVDWDTHEHIGQAWNNYWLKIDSTASALEVPSEEIEKIAWIDITPENIKNYFNVHDDEGFLECLLPYEWQRIKAKYQLRKG